MNVYFDHKFVDYLVKQEETKAVLFDEKYDKYFKSFELKKIYVREMFMSGAASDKIDRSV